MLPARHGARRGEGTVWSEFSVSFFPDVQFLRQPCIEIAKPMLRFRIVIGSYCQWPAIQTQPPDDAHSGRPPGHPNCGWPWAGDPRSRYPNVVDSVHNKLRDNVTGVYGIVIFYDVRGEPIDVYPINYRGMIPAGTAKRISGRVDRSVERLNCPDQPFPYLNAPPRPPKGKVEFRILDFNIE
jgi:hypothetical protein